jgi:hypothetical protein
MITSEYKTPEYNTWRHMRQRCRNPAHKSYSYYGGRGINVVSAWDDYLVFLGDMGRRPLGHSLDRIDSNGNYESGNCRWASWKTQERNRRNNRNITHEGKTQCVSAWAEDFGICKTKLGKSLYRNANSMREALIELSQSYVWKTFQYKGQNQTMKQIASDLGCGYDALKKYLRLNRNDLEKAVAWYTRKRRGA